MTDDPVRIFGIRHHGPGSARSLVRALEAMAPDAILVEGPPDAEDILPLAANAEMKPPVALLVYVPDEPQKAVFYPFARYSPEWQAIRLGLARDVPVRFIDLPQRNRLAEPDAAETGDDIDEREPDPVRSDPLGSLAEAAGFADGERWWDLLIESRRGGGGAGEIFQAVSEAMTTLRESVTAVDDLLEQRREAHMRQCVRAAVDEGFARIAVVCGAWHAPAIAQRDEKGRLGADRDLLKGLAKVKTAAAWTPWSYDRMALESGYGAGVDSPEWYDLLWSGDGNLAVRWLTRAARLMRKQDLDASSAHVIEAARLAETLAALRGRPGPGLEELDEAALTVMCFGMDAPMQLIRDRLVVGRRLGAVPEDAPATPLQRDLARHQKSLRLPPSADHKDYDLDLRKPNDLARSHLLHRLNLLGIPWGSLQRQQNDKGTFHERWRLQWRVEFAVSLIDAGRWGSTVAEAAAQRVARSAAEAEKLATLTGLVEDALLAELPEAVASLVAAIADRTALAADVLQLMEALPPLANVSRYGNVRQTDAESVLGVVDGLVARICVGLPAACASLDDEAAGHMLGLIDGSERALTLLRNDEHLGAWRATLRQLMEQGGLHGLIAGRAARLLHDAGDLDGDELARRLSLALSLATEPAAAAAWIEGLLGGSGLILIHDDGLWQLVDAWLVGLGADHFTEILPLLRRTFAAFPPPERRQMGKRVVRGAASRVKAAAGDAAAFDVAAADAVLPVLAQLLGLESPEPGGADGSDR